MHADKSLNPTPKIIIIKKINYYFGTFFGCLIITLNRKEF